LGPARLIRIAHANRRIGDGSFARTVMDTITRVSFRLQRSQLRLLGQRSAIRAGLARRLVEENETR